MTQSLDIATLLSRYISERFDNKGSQLLARAVNDRFTEHPGVDFISRNTIDNWCRGYAKTVREWEKLAAVAVVLGLSQTEADELLRAAGQPSVSEKQLNAEKKIEKEILAYWDSSFVQNANTTSATLDLPKRDKEQNPAYASALPAQAVSKTSARFGNYNSVWQWLLLVLILLLFALSGFATWQNWNSPPKLSYLNNEVDPQPVFSDDFSNPSQWNLNEATFVAFDRGQLLFDAPINQTGSWRSDVVVPQWNVEKPISHMRFTAALDMLPSQTWGFLGVQTECNATDYANDNGSDDWLMVYIGGPDRTVWVEYTPNEQLVPVEGFRFAPVVNGQSYQIDLIWHEESVQVYVDEKPQGAPIPCLQPMRFNLNAGLDTNMQMRGYIDNFALWE